MVYCHGLAGSRTTYSGSCKDLASHGYIVFSLSHFDGTANYSKKKSGEELYWSSMIPYTDIEFRRGQILVRKLEVQHLIDDLYQDKFLQETLDFDQESSLDLTKLVVGGHSFGGMTAIEIAKSDSRCKYHFAIDPWLWVVFQAMMDKEYSISQPQIQVCSEFFSDVCEEHYKFSTN